MWEGRTREIERPPIAEINRIAATLATRGTDLINLGQAIVGLPPPEAAVTMVRRYLDETACHVYSPDPGIPELREAIAIYLRERKHIPEAVASRIMATCGANQAFVNAILTVTNPGDEVVFFGPNYFDHVFAIKLGACVPMEVEMPSGTDGRFTIDFDALERALTPRTRCLVVVSPGNPTGSLVPAGDMARLCELCRDRRIWLVSDETYDLLTYAPEGHTSPASLGIHDRVIVLASFSKTFSLAAWRMAYMYGPEEMIEESIKVQDALVVCAPVPSQMAVIGALLDVDRYRARIVPELKSRKGALFEILQASKSLDPVTPDGGTFILAKISGFHSSLGYCRELVTQTGIITVPGSAFGIYGEGYVRISFGNQPVERIREAGDRLRTFEETVC